MEGGRGDSSSIGREKGGKTAPAKARLKKKDGNLSRGAIAQEKPL